jgi:hypothetical protein
VLLEEEEVSMDFLQLGPRELIVQGKIIEMPIVQSRGRQILK